MPQMDTLATGPLLPHGYLPVALVLPEPVVPSFLAEAKARSYNGVFNRVGGEDDNFRQQSRVNPRSIVVVATRVEQGSEGGVYHAASWVGTWCFLFHAFDTRGGGGSEQEPHQDYQESDLGRAREHHPGGVPASMFFALEPDTKLRIYVGCFTARNDSKARVVEIPVGFCVLFRGDLIHNGMPYTTTNYRLRYYLSYAGMKWTPDIVQDALPQHGECQYCGEKVEKGQTLWKQRFYCEKKNPRGLRTD
ncbi:hypothetical protein F443_16910 [Phytophthora nicotianae P1569]|uniref:Prolyl 4-hydroxylase alpha subunit Fe(2+) 2OG dioxygenase domain-containing protein n=1 Tax=Phytophthora nicotianae P1569 TaxID=1317065 RepID=V9ED56_PHYNI|nr:hypothetical protein F443_16910 [Phytophthora nicotianae P1569]